MAATSSKSAEIRAKLTHPIIDSDGHLIEVTPVLYDYIRAEGGEQVLERFKAQGGPHWTQVSLDQRRDARLTASTWWLVPTKNGLDRATAMIPRLLAERLDELGLDFCVLYPSTALPFPSLADEELRRVCCRAYNKYAAEMYAPYSRQMTPAALIPMHTPEEGIEELEFASRELGLKVAAMAGYVRRPIKKLQREYPGASGQFSVWHDVYGEDSEYDYDPFWAKAIELGMPLSTHSAGFGFTNNSNINNFMQNHLGHFANAANVLCKSMFFSGVTRRFPALRMAFLECGAGWAADLYAGIIARWEKRNPETLQGVDPSLMDEDRIMELFAAYGDARAVSKLEEIKESLVGTGVLAGRNAPEDLNDFSRSGVTKPGRHPRPVRPQLLLRLRGRRPHERHRLRLQDRSPPRARRCHAQFRHRPLGRHRHARRGRGSLRDGRARPHDRRRLPRLHLRQPPPLLHRPQPRLLRRHRHRSRGQGGPRPSLLQPLPRRGSTLSPPQGEHLKSPAGGAPSPAGGAP